MFYLHICGFHFCLTLWIIVFPVGFLARPVALERVQAERACGLECAGAQE